MCSVSGVVADANYLIDHGRLEGQRYQYRYSQQAPVEEIVKAFAYEKHSYTQFGSSRPFGVSIMYAGYDKVRGFQLYNSDPSGNYSSYKAHATGKNSVNAISALKNDYEEGLDQTQALALAAKNIAKTMDSTTPDASKFEIGMIALDVNGNAFQRLIEGEELQKLLEENKVFELMKEQKK